MGAPIPDLSPKPGPKAATLARLRTEIARIEHEAGPAAPSAGGAGGAARAGRGTVPLGIGAIDGHLGGGLARRALHEIVAADGGAAATGFALALVARILATDSPPHWLWCTRGAALYGPGLAAMGAALDAALVVRCADDAEVLWAMEEALACRHLACVCGEAGAIGALASRRLALASRSHGVTAIALRPAAAARAPSAAATRWRAAGRAGGNGKDGAWAWRLELLRGRGAMPRAWDVLYRCDGRDAARLTAADDHDGAAFPSPSPSPSEDAREDPAADPVPAPSPLRRRTAARPRPACAGSGPGARPG